MSPKFLRRYLIALALMVCALAAGISTAAASEPGQGAGEATLLERALARHAGLRAARNRLLASRARFLEATSVRPPRLEVQVMSPPSFKGSQVSLMQPFDRQERLDWAGRRALAEELEARAEASRIEADIRRGVRTLLAERTYLREAMRLLDRAQARTRELAHVASARYSVGKASQSELSRAQLRQTDLAYERIVREEEAANVDAKLGALVEGDPGRPPSREGGREPAPGSPPRFALSAERLLAAGLDHAPYLLALRAATTRAEAEVALARLDAAAPMFDVGLMLGKSQAMGDPMIGASVGLDLPVLRPARSDHARVAAERSLEAVRGASEQARLDLRERIAVSLNRISSLESRIRLYADVLEPQAELAERTAQAAYLAGQVPFSDLLDRQADRDAIERSGWRLLADHAQAVADLEAAIGMPFEEIAR